VRSDERKVAVHLQANLQGSRQHVEQCTRAQRALEQEEFRHASDDDPILVRARTEVRRNARTEVHVDAEHRAGAARTWQRAIRIRRRKCDHREAVISRNATEREQR
jgi:hypothetical protein